MITQLLIFTVFTSPPTDLVIPEGMAARFDCGFTATVPVSISWFKDGTILTPSSKYMFLLNNSLVINSTEPGDDVTYTCAVTNQINLQVQQQSATLDFACKNIVIIQLNPDCASLACMKSPYLYVIVNEPTCIHPHPPPHTHTHTHTHSVPRIIFYQSFNAGG